MRLVALATLLVAAQASADTYQSKKDIDRAQKTTQHRAPLASGTKPRKLINLYNRWTHDWLPIDPTSLPTAHEVNTFLRDHFTNELTSMDGKLIGVVVKAAQRFKCDGADIVSGFRHPKFNLMLRKKGHQVARDSQHTHGNAVDFVIPTATTEQLLQWAKSQRLGGVGYYPHSQFVHMDTGPIRYWTGD